MTFTRCNVPDDGRINITPEQLSVELNGTLPQAITFEANGEWYTRVTYRNDGANDNEENGSVETGNDDENSAEDDRWLNVTPTSGSADQTSITVQAITANYTQQARRADLLIKLPGSEGVTIAITQPPTVRPAQLTTITRTLSGGAVNGPSQISFEYDDNDNMIAFTSVDSRSGTIRYSVTETSSSATITATTSSGESSITATMVNGLIYSCGPVEWTFSDPNSGIVMDRSSVTFNFRYDNSENKLLQSITRAETVSVEDGETLSENLSREERYEFVFSNLRIDSIYHILPYDPSDRKAMRDTVAYKLNYPAESVTNNLTADLWDMIVMPEAQGTPFYSITGFWLFGLTGTIQGEFPETASVEARIHTGRTDIPSAVRYTYVDDGGNLNPATADINYADGSTANYSMRFSYKE